MFWRENWHWLLALIVVISVGGFILFKPKTPVTVKKVYKVPDFSQVRKDTASKGGETPAEQTVAENTETPLEKSADPADDSPETPLESPGEKVSLENVEDVAKLAVDPDDWRNASYGESDYGFGTYPQIPSDYPDEYRPFWTFDLDRDGHQNTLRPRELLARVRIKLWKQGQTDVKLSFDHHTQKIYVIEPNMVYVRTKETKTANGTSKIVRFVGDSNALSSEVQTKIRSGEKTPGIRILDYDSSGFNVYEFLGLNP